MTHPTLQPLQVLLEQAEQDRDEALARQVQAERALQAAQAQQAQLHDYRSEYENRWGSQFRQGVTMTLVQCYQDFVGRLHGAVDLQGQQVERAQHALERVRHETLAAELRVASVRKLMERREGALLRQSDRRDQKSQDEMASRAAWQRLHEQRQLDQRQGAQSRM
jgi:flagellar FliJ protein